MLNNDFHNSGSISFLIKFDKYALCNLPFVIMESETRADWLNYHHLRYFHVVAVEGSVRRGEIEKRGEARGVEQSGASFQLAPAHNATCSYRYRSGA